MANIVITTMRITGHLAMSHAWTALEPRPRTLPACLASPPVKVTPTATRASMSNSTSVVPTRVGSVFQIGRPSPTS